MYSRCIEPVILIPFSNLILWSTRSPRLVYLGNRHAHKFAYFSQT